MSTSLRRLIETGTGICHLSSYQHTRLTRSLCLQWHTNLKRHYMTHNSKKCPYCDYEDEKRSRLSVHIRSHNNEYSCELCGFKTGVFRVSVNRPPPHYHLPSSIDSLPDCFVFLLLQCHLDSRPVLGASQEFRGIEFLVVGIGRRSFTGVGC